MARRTPDRDEMVDLARRIAKANPEVQRELRYFLAGISSVTDALPAFRAVLRRIIFETGDPVRVSKSLRADVDAWAAKWGTGKESAEPTIHGSSIRWTQEQLDIVDAARKLCDYGHADFVRMAAVRLAELVLQSVKDADAE